MINHYNVLKEMHIKNNDPITLSQLLKFNYLDVSHVTHLLKICRKIPDALPESAGIELLISEDYQHARLYFQTQHRENPPMFLTCHQDEDGLCQDLPQLLDRFYEEWNSPISFISRGLQSVGYRMNYNDKEDYIMNDLFFQMSDNLSEKNTGESDSRDIFFLYKEIYQLITKKHLSRLASEQLRELFFQMYHLGGIIERMKVLDLCDKKTSRFYFKAPDWNKVFEILAFGHWPGDFDYLRTAESVFRDLFDNFSFELEISEAVKKKIGIRAFMRDSIEEKKSSLIEFSERLKKLDYLSKDQKDKTCRTLEKLATDESQENLLKNSRYVKILQDEEGKLYVRLFFKMLFE